MFYRGESASAPPYAPLANHYRAIWAVHEPHQRIWALASFPVGCEQFLHYKRKKCARSTVDLLTSLN